MTEWEMFGWRGDKLEDHWLAIGEYHYVRFHGCDEPTPITVMEDSDGTHLGWIDTGETDPVMVLDHRIFEIQFPYGSNAEVEAGKGRVVRLSIREV